MAEVQKSGAGRGCGTGCLVMVALFVGLAIFSLVGVVGSLATADESGVGGVAELWRRHGAGGRAGSDEAPYLQEEWSAGKGETKVVRIPLRGMIMLGEDSWYGGNANTVLRSIRRATHDSEVQGLLLEINSGGGGITDSDIIYQSLLDFKAAATGRVVVALCGDVAASGAYYIALAADRIIAHPTTLTGSIGVIMQSYNISELAARLGIRDVTIKSGANKDLLNPFREVKPEQERMMQEVISAMHRRFTELVAKGRGLSEAEVAKLADGRIFLADEALKHRLIDAIGYREEAQLEVARLLEVTEVKFYRYSEPLGFMDLLARPTIGLGAFLRGAAEAATMQPRPMYLWQL